MNRVKWAYNDIIMKIYNYTREKNSNKIWLDKKGNY
jgi:hypothetical protein